MIIAVASGKGGTGKTMVATSLALALAKEMPVQLLDCDVEEPDAHVLLRPSLNLRQEVTVPVPELVEEKCNRCGRCAEVCAYNAIAVLAQRVLVFPELCHGCGACSYLCPEGALIEVKREVGTLEWGLADGIGFVHGRLNIGEAMATPVIREVKKPVGCSRVTVIDVAPGTSCPVVEAVSGSHFCLLVTEPTPFGLNDLALAVDMVNKLGIPCGVVINRDVSGYDAVDDYCLEQGIPVMLRLPLDMEIARLYSQGIPLIKGRPEWRETFIGLYRDIERRVLVRTGSGEK